MLYRTYQGMKLSRLGFGCMRFVKDEATGAVDQEKVNAMFDRAIAAGVNYFDTAYPYLGGQSEGIMAEALSRYPRDSYYIADKFPGHALPGPIDNTALFEVSLRKCRTDYFDFYLLHNVTEWSVKTYENPAYHIIPDLLRQKEAGRIRKLGFSFHGGADLLEEFLSRHEGEFDFVQLQCNYLDWTLQNARRKYDIVTRHGLGVWVMEPCRGGKLAKLSEENAARLRAFDPEASCASFAFRFLMELPNVQVILSGMTELPQVEDNLRTFSRERPLSDAERDTLLEIAETMKKGVPCTACRYCCAGCPKGLDIPYLLECYNNMKIAVALSSTMRLDGLEPDKLPSACIGCGKCRRACPQGIDVPAAMKELDAMYAAAPKWSEKSKGRQESIRRDLHL